MGKLDRAWQLFNQSFTVLNTDPEILLLPAMSGVSFVLVGLGFLVVALSMGLLSVRDNTDFEAVQLWRIQWLMAACAAFLAGILLKTRKAEN